MDFINDFLKAFIPMFVAVDVIGVLPFFLGITENMDRRVRKKLIRQSVLTATLIAVAFVFVGQALFRYMGIGIPDFMIAGGAVLFLISAHDLIVAEKSGPADVTIGVVPLGTPLLAGPAVLATALIVIRPYGLAATLLSIVINFLIAGVSFHFSGVIVKLLGRSGARALSKIMVLILSAYAVMMIRQGVMQIIHSVH